MAPGRTWAQIASGNKSAASAACADVVGTKSGTDTIPSKLPSLLSTHAGSTEAPCPNALSKTQVDCDRDEDWCMVPPAPGLPEPSVAVLPAPGLPQPEPHAAQSRKDDIGESFGALMGEGAIPAPAVDVKDDGALRTGLADAQTATCVSEPVSAEPLRDDMSSTAASEHEKSESCILCSGSGLLCDGLLADVCPLCDSGERPEAHGRSSSSASADASPKGVERSPEKGTDLAPDDVGAGEDAAVPRAPALHVVSKEGTKMTAPPGIGPPGIWIWPHDDDKKGDAEIATTEADLGDRTVNWPESSVESVEVEFVGRVAQGCFGPDFKKMTVSWAETRVEGKLALSIANVQLHLEQKAPVNFLAPLVRLQALLTRDQKLFQCQIFRMERSKDNASMHITCAQVSTATCWDVLKSGYCPRANCTWQHPAPSVICVSVAGGPPTQQTTLASLMPKPAADSGSDKVKAEDFYMVPPMLNNPVQLNFGAFDDFTDSSESEDM